jgi:UDP-N-acetylglucosamine 2-epimerase (non-hydrolysing)
MTSTRLLHVAGARPNFMKIAPIMTAVDRWNSEAGSGASTAPGSRGAKAPGARASSPDPVTFTQVLVHTGQHYDQAMSDVFFRELGLPEPDHNLGVGSGSHAVQTAEVLRRLEPVLLEERPDLVVVVGDVNSTLAAALCAAKLHIPVAHVEAGLRSGDRLMPEELNRILTDQLADLLFTTSEDAEVNLTREGVPAARIHFVGNTMIDTLDRLKDLAVRGDAPQRYGVAGRAYALVTLHRPSNVDDPEQLELLGDVLAQVARQMPVVFPVHARTRGRLAGRLEGAATDAAHGLRLTEPLGYLDFVALMSGARVVLTDSGGVQEETTALGVPCITLRTTTERPVTITHGTNELADPYSREAVLAAVDRALGRKAGTRQRPPLWDGEAAGRLTAQLARWAEAAARD